MLNTNDIVLKIDISSYFESIVHKKLVLLLKEFSKESILRSYNIDKDSITSLEFYFESLMMRQTSIPQGRKNFVSDYLGYLYLIPFDLKIDEILKGTKLKFKALVRYVDDINIIFEKPNNLSDEDIFKELLTIEQSISNWLFRNLSLKISPHKSERYIFKSRVNIDKYLKLVLRSISSPDVIIRTKMLKEKSEISRSFTKFTKALEKFKYSSGDKFSFNFTKDEVENLKEIFKNNFQNYVLKKESQYILNELLKTIKYELATDYINIILTLFYTKNLKNKYTNIYLNYLLNNLNLKDKRFIHLLLITLAQNINKGKFMKSIQKNKFTLIKDDYGKYLLLFFLNSKDIDLLSVDKRKFYLKSNNTIYNRIKLEFNGANERKFFYSSIKDDYLTLIKLISESDDLKVESVIQQIKEFIYNYQRNKYYISFNSFHNLFHEICKIKLGTKENESKANVKKLIKDLSSKYPHIELKDELLIMKFFDRRNFNAISHPSQKNTPTVMVTEDELMYYLKRIIKLLLKLF